MIEKATEKQEGEKQKFEMTLGLRDDVPEALYHQSPGISKHALDQLAISPLHYKTHKDNPEPPTPAMVLGSAFHCLVLTPELFDQEFASDMGKPKKPTAAQLNAKNGPTEKTLTMINELEAWESQRAGKIIIKSKPGDNPFWSPGDWQQIHNMRDAVRAHPVASILLDLDPEVGWSERSPYWMDKQTGRLCRSRIDRFNEAHGLAIDLKSAVSSGYSDFCRAVVDYRYDVQAAMYTAGLKAVGVPVKAFVFIVVEKKPPYAIGIYTLDQKARHIGHVKWRQSMQTFDECKTADKWPSYPEEVRELILPPWAEKGKYY